jgi:hypothetical protein
MKNSLPELFNKYGGFFKTHGIRGEKIGFIMECDVRLEFMADFSF